MAAVSLVVGLGGEDFFERNALIGGSSVNSSRLFWFPSKTLKNMSISLGSTVLPMTEFTIASNSDREILSFSFTFASITSMYEKKCLKALC